MAFRGTFDHTLDAKNRLTVPARFRATLAEGIVLATGIERCVAIWRPPDYDAFTKTTLQGHSPLSPQTRQLTRFFSANSHDTELDSAGRVMLPAFLVEYAGLGRDVVVTGAGDCLEIWDRAAWASYNQKLIDTMPDITASLGSPS